MARKGPVLRAPGGEAGWVVNGIESSLEMLGKLAMAYRLAPMTRRIAVETLVITGPADRGTYVRAFITELHLRANPEALHIIGSEEPITHHIDADDACLLVASCALSIGIPCRFIFQRYGQSWTVRLGYEVDGRWEVVDCLNQSTLRLPDEEFVGEEMRP